MGERRASSGLHAHTVPTPRACTGMGRRRSDVAAGCRMRTAEPIDRAELIEACQVCPVDALMVLSAGGEQIVP